MKSSAIKILQSYLNKKNVNNLKKKISKRNVILGLITVIFISLLSFFFRPYFFDYQINKEAIQNQIKNYLKTDTKINGDISFNFFPSPRLVVEDIELNLDNESNYKIYLKKSNLILSPINLKSIDNLKLKKIYVHKQKIKLYPEIIKKYLIFLKNPNIGLIDFNNCEFFFEDNQSNIITVDKVNFKNKVNNKKLKFNIKGLFSSHKFKINFINNLEKEKLLDFSMPILDTKLKVKFDKNSSLDKASGKLNLKFFNNILLVNFYRDETYKISNSYYRSKYLNSRLDGSINFKNNFFFNLNFFINQINLKKILTEYNSYFKKNNNNQFNISKKINGEIKLKFKKTNSFIGQINNLEFILLFENGDLKINSGTANLNEKGLFKFNFSLLGKGKDQKINFILDLETKEPNKLLKKFNLSSDYENISFNTLGSIKVIDRKITFQNLVVNNENLSPENTKVVKNLLEEYVLKDSIFGFLEFFKIKKFAYEVSRNLE